MTDGQGFRSLTPAARLLVFNQFGINVGFYMVLPFLASYLRDDLGYGAALVGLVLGVRNLSQQGMFLVGGSAADRLGCRPMIILGCALRVVAFGAFALFTTLPGIVVAAVLTGLAGALFNPAVRTYLTHESPGRRAEVFAVFNVFAHAGALVGPLLGAALLLVDFRLVALVACAAFAVLTVAQVLVLPARPTETQDRGVLGSWWEVVTNRRFVAFTLFGAAYFALYNQLYLALPLEAQRVTGSTASISVVFVVSTVVGIALQVRLTRWLRARRPAGWCVAAGLATMGAGFVPLLVAAPLTPTRAGAGSLGAAVLVALPVLAGTVVFTIGMAITDPFVMDLLPVVGSERLAGTYYGFFYLVSALVTAAVAALVGALIDLPGQRWAPPAALIAVALLGALGVARMHRRGLLELRPVPVPAAKEAT
ncbi:MFS transporter [Pseudonocardia acidicola]|uniref:MFS transporter n=1 Tax=Pseudonocardia acidicola TaxID=2724939 RepID=A0ABX1S7P8_9PSEU|nr:MFS transporter [Pseudonocardia acidicola]NMH96178.1 MFS transporter [Pseudonocardia acidicola]